METRGKWWEVMAFMVMVVMEGCTIGLTIMAKTVMSRGMSPFIFVFYSTALSSLILLPHSFIFLIDNNSSQRPVFSGSFLVRIFFLGFTGVTIPQNLAFTGLNYSSPILVCIMGCLIPAFSFLLGIILRNTKIVWRNSNSRAKIIGTSISIMGAIFVTVYKGPLVRGSSSSHELKAAPTLFIFSSTPEHWALGGILLASSFFSISVWNIIQLGTLKQYPEVMTVVSFYSLMGTIQCAVVTLIAERSLSAWKLQLNMELLLIILSAMFGSVIRSRVHLWCMSTKGPLYVPMFRPFGIVIAVIICVTFFASSLHFGSVVGGVIVGMGYYIVMWGLVREQDETHEESLQGDERSINDSSDKNVPLLEEESSLLV